MTAKLVHPHDRRFVLVAQGLDRRDTRWDGFTAIRNDLAGMSWKYTAVVAAMTPSEAVRILKADKAFQKTLHQSGSVVSDVEISVDGITWPREWGSK